jgi:hypothetical protein
MKIEMIGMNTFPQSNFHIKLLTKYEPVIPFFQLVHGLHPLLPTKYMLPSRPSDNKDQQPIRVLTSRLFQLEKL